MLQAATRDGSVLGAGTRPLYGLLGSGRLVDLGSLSALAAEKERAVPPQPQEDASSRAAVLSRPRVRVSVLL